MSKPVGSRTPFTNEDEQNLVEYIATQRPEPHGRLGNVLYIQLEENAGNRWPWAKRHPWMSWRERYKKNQDLFDYRIRKYQKSKLKEKQAELNEEKKEEDEEQEQDLNSNVEQNETSAPEARPVKIAERREGEKKKTVPSKPASDARQQKVVATWEEGTKSVSSKLSHGRRPQIQAENTEKEARIVASKSTSHSRPQTVAEKPGNEVGTKAFSSKQKMPSRPPKPVSQQKQGLEDEPSETEDEHPVTHNDSVQSLSENEMRDLFGSFVEDDEGEEEEEEKEETQLERSNASGPNEDVDSVIEILDPRPAPNIYPNLQNALTPAIEDPEPHVPGAFDVQPRVPSPEPDVSKAKTNRTKPTRRPRPRLKQNKQDPFETSSDSSSKPSRPPAARRTSATKKLPVMEEGPFRTTFKRSRATAADDDEEEEARPWPPKRSKKERDAANQYNEAATFARSRQIAQVNAVASSSKTMLPPSIPTDDLSAIIPRTHSEPLFGYDVLSRSSVTKRPTVGDTANPRSSTNMEQTAVPNPKHQGRFSAPILKPSINKVNNEITSTSTARSRTDHHHNLPTKPSSDTDPFTAKHQQHPVSDKGAGKARADDSYVIGDENENPKPSRHIDLHQETLSKRRRLTNNSRLSRRSSVLSSRASLSSLSPKKDRPRRSNSLRKSISELNLPDADTKEFLLAAAESIAEALEKMAEDYEFSIDYVEDTFKKTRSIEKTNLALKQLRRDLDQLQQETMEKQKALYARINLIANPDGDENDSDNELPYGLFRRNSNNGKANGKSSTRSSPRKSKSKRPSLNIKPIVTDDDDDVISDYSPPGSSRAGQFARLVRQGRKEEAIEREKRRASGVFVPSTQHGGGRNGRSLLAREITATPTPHSRDTVPVDIDSNHDHDHNTMDQDDDDDGDDMYVRTDDEKINDAQHRAPSEHKHEADDEFEQTQQTQDKEQGDRSRVLEDEDPPTFTQSQIMQEPVDARDRNKVLIQEVQDRHRALALEHRILAMNVNAENADEMRQFEARNDPDFLRLMSLQLIGDLVAKYHDNRLAKREE